MSRIRNSLALARSSWAVLKADKELVLLPVISGIASLIVASSFILPIILADSAYIGGATIGSIRGAPIGLLLLMYFVLAYITIFFNAALISAANERLEGGDPTIGSAIRGAARRAGKILPWALLSAVVSVILRAIEERVGFVGKIVIALVGMAWTVVTFLVLPIIVVEGVGTGKALKKSGSLLRKPGREPRAPCRPRYRRVPPDPPVDRPGGCRDRVGRHRGGGVAIGLGVLWGIIVMVVMAAPDRHLPDSPVPLRGIRPCPSGYFRQHRDAVRVPDPSPSSATLAGYHSRQQSVRTLRDLRKGA